MTKGLAIGILGSSVAVAGAGLFLSKQDTQRATARIERARYSIEVGVLGSWIRVPDADEKLLILDFSLESNPSGVRRGRPDPIEVRISSNRGPDVVARVGFVVGESTRRSSSGEVRATAIAALRADQVAEVAHFRWGKLPETSIRIVDPEPLPIAYRDPKDDRGFTPAATLKGLIGMQLPLGEWTAKLVRVYHQAQPILYDEEVSGPQLCLVLDLTNETNEVRPPEGSEFEAWFTDAKGRRIEWSGLLIDGITSEEAEEDAARGKTVRVRMQIPCRAPAAVRELALRSGVRGRPLKFAQIESELNR